MSWLRKTGNWLARFLTWKTRINRAQFAICYFGMAFFGALLGNMVIFAVMSFTGASIEQIFDDLPRATLPYFAVIAYLLMCALAARAHDVGWSAAIPVVAFLLPWPAWFVVMDQELMVLNGAAAFFLEHISMDQLLIAMFIGLIIYMGVLIALFFMPGQKGENRFGPSPSAP